MEKSTEGSKRRVAAKPSPKAVFACPTCDVTFMTSDAWRNHRRERHEYVEGTEIQLQQELLAAVRTMTTIVDVAGIDPLDTDGDVEPDDPAPPPSGQVADVKPSTAKNTTVGARRKRRRSLSMAKMASESAVPVRKSGKQDPPYVPKRKITSSGGAPPVAVPSGPSNNSFPLPSATTNAPSDVMIRSVVETPVPLSTTSESFGVDKYDAGIPVSFKLLKPEVISTHDLVTIVNEQPTESAFDLALAIGLRAGLNPEDRKSVRSRLSAIIAARKDVGQRLMRILLEIRPGQERSALLQLVGDLVSSPALRGFE